MNYSDQVLSDTKSYLAEKKDFITKFLINPDTRVINNPLLLQITTYLIKNVNQDNELEFIDLIEILFNYLVATVTNLELLERDLTTKIYDVKEAINFYLDLDLNIVKEGLTNEEEEYLVDLEEFVLSDIYNNLNYDNTKINTIYQDYYNHFKKDYTPFSFYLESVADELNIVHDFTAINFD